MSLNPSLNPSFHFPSNFGLFHTIFQRFAFYYMRYHAIKDITYNKSELFKYINKTYTLEQEDIDRIERYIKGESDEREREYVELFFINGENNPYLRSRINLDFDQMLREVESPNVKTGHILDRIHQVIRKEEIKKNNKSLRRILRVYMKAAAILLIPLLLTGGVLFNYLSDKYIKNTGEDAVANIYAPYGSRVSFSLPDGTTGMLNSGSSMTYHLPFSQNRNVKLEGEAWFEVKHNEQSPFFIDAGSSVIRVLGTSFNISAYPNEDYVEVVLAEGKVEFLDSFRKQKEILKPGERLVNTGGKIDKFNVETEKYSAWTEGRLVFRGDPMPEVARRIERWYNVKVIIADKQINNYSFRATFEDDKLEDVLRYLTMTSPISYKITPQIALPDGSFTKEEITIYKSDN
jgi:transmembrane sensor